MKLCKRFFSLIELLVVIAVIAILMGILLPAVNSVRSQAKKTKAKSEMNAVKTAIQQYEATYGVFPAASATDLTTDANYRTLIELLTNTDGPDAGTDITSNARKIVFLDVPSTYGNDTTNRDIGNMDKGDYADPWGNKYMIYVDTDYDGRVTDPAGGDDLNGTVFIYSWGPDGTDNDSKGDDLATWK